jgi:hypothetical protein
MLLPRSRTARVDIADCKLVNDYIINNIDSWYDFARQFFVERQAPEGSLVLVRGCDRTESWVAAAFTERSVDAGLMFNGGLEPSGFKLKGSWKQTSYSFPETRDSEARAAPLTLSIEPTPTVLAAKFPPECRETVFIRVFKCWRRFGRLKIPKIIKAAAGPHDLPDPDGDPGSSAVASGNTSLLEYMATEPAVDIDPQQPDFVSCVVHIVRDSCSHCACKEQASDRSSASAYAPGRCIFFWTSIGVFHQICTRSRPILNTPSQPTPIYTASCLFVCPSLARRTSALTVVQSQSDGDWADVPGAIQASEVSVCDDDSYSAYAAAFFCDVG